MLKNNSTMMTSKLSGGFKQRPEVREEFYNFIKKLSK